MDDEIPEYDESSSYQLPCNTCGRTFREDILARHARICEKSTTKKRKVFDSSKMRAQGTDLANAPKKTHKEPPPTRKNNWRRRHEDFIEAMRSAKGVTKAIKTGAPLPPPPSQKRIDPDYVQCPSCDRNFNQTAAERHIPWCKERNKRIDKKPTPSKSNKDKLTTRTQYKPPLPGSKNKQASPANRTAPRSKIDTGMGELESRMNGSMKIGSRTSVRNKPYTGSKARSASLERPSPKALPNSYRSSSGDKGRRDFRETVTYSPTSYQAGDSRYDGYDDEDDYDYPNSRHGSAGRRLEPISKPSSGKSTNHVLPHDRLRMVSDESGFTLSTSRTPTPPSSRPLSGARKTSADLVNGRRLPKFCHECGTKYPVPSAKYCCECGTRRAYID